MSNLHYGDGKGCQREIREVGQIMGVLKDVGKSGENIGGCLNKVRDVEKRFGTP
jgi:hypothetical protein